MRAALGNRTPDLRITRAFSCVARGFKARAGFMFAGCCWRRSLAVDGSSGTSRGHASAAQSSQEHWPRPSAHTWLRLSPLETGCTGNTCRVRAGRRVVEKQGRRAHRRGVRGRRAPGWRQFSGWLSPWCQGMAPYPGQASCLALGFWPECFRRLDVKGGRRPFPEETRSVLDIEGKHVTIQGAIPGPEPGPPFAPSTGCQDLQIRRSRHIVQDRPAPVVYWVDIRELSTCVGAVQRLGNNVGHS